MSDPTAVESARDAYQRARHAVSYAHFTVVRHQEEIDAHHPDGSVDFPWSDGPWDAHAEADALEQEKQAEADARVALDKALDAYRKLDPDGFAATAKADAEAAEKAYNAKKAEMDEATHLESSDSFWKQMEILPELERLESELEVARGSASIASGADASKGPLTGTPSDEPQELSDVDTGHYDDGHGFGWTKPAPAPPDDLDTGHYDDGHSFGWGTKKKAVVAGGIVAAILAIVAGAVALTSGGGGGSTAKPVPSVPADSSQSSSSSSTVSALPLDTVLAGCIAIDPQGGTTILHPGFLVANPQSGAYSATFANGPTGSVHGNGTANGNLIVTDVTITAFGTYDGLTLTGPSGTPIALGPIASQLPLEINAQTDKPNGCDPHGLEMPAAASPSGDGAQTSIVSFLSQFSSASQNADVAFLAGALDPAVLTRYGRDQCTADLSAVPADPSANLAFMAITSGPEPYTYTSDGQSTVVPNTYTVAVSRTANGTTADSSLHLSIDPAGSVHWFTDCTH